MAWCVRDGTGQLVESINSGSVLSTASVGKILLLLAVADAFETGGLDPTMPVSRSEPVTDSGLWQHLSMSHISAHDAAVLVGSVSDNLASNALLDVIGLDHVQATAADIGFPALHLHDRVRDHRTPEHPPHLSSGSAAQWSALMHELSTERLITPGVSRQVLRWLGLSVDHSLVLAPFALDPLVADRPKWICANKTGADPGVRADVGVVRNGDLIFSYAALAADEDELEAVVQLRTWGQSLLERFVD
jgi:beta-lactamase class A